MRKIDVLQRRLKQVVPGQQLYNAPIDCLAKGTDAGFYRLIPQLVVQVNNETEVSEVLRICQEMNIAVTFKAGGTSLSGQTISDSVLIEIGPEYNNITIHAEGQSASFQPGVSGGFANRQLLKYGRKIGPSPASINAAKIGGIVANNASGASYGIATNSYNTLKSIRMVLVDGTVCDTASMKSRADFEK
ncbi:MAG: FAD-binding oxidoreductase, partial [Marinilabiliaceae bacterium]|nr:FAD-binding oxidoreductase [Marinilabiliaceae bacterium]